MKKQEVSGNYPLEMWAGLESTVNRVGDKYMDQMERNGHATRVEDIARFAGLGIKKMRYPILWERIAPQGLKKADWSWADERLGYLQAYGIQPIVGLVHHGSGPMHTCLVKPCFVTGLREYASVFAQRYPWVEYYTPVNEPLTTARFSGLYGHWYPHGKEGAIFARALLNQCRATAECMQVIREVNSSAKLVLTEDLGKTYSTPLMAYQAKLDNERRWMSMDLLTGKLTPDKIMWQYLLSYGIEKYELQWFLDHPCPPYIIGINHYPTSERYLDENIELYPEWSHGSTLNHYPKEMLDGNDFHSFADIDAIRVRPQGEMDYYVGHYTLLKETWERYGLPMAVTEVHLCGPREQQVAWLQGIWNIALRLREEEVDIRAITAWSLLGTYDWVNLVTRDEGFYEPGVFDIRGPEPRPTALARLITHLAKGTLYSHPLQHVQAWWRRKDRFLYPLSSTTQMHANQGVELSITEFAYEKINVKPVEEGLCNAKPNLRPVLIIGKSTSLGSAYARVCEQRFLPYYALDWLDFNKCDAMSIEKLLERVNPWAVINTTNYITSDSVKEYNAHCPNNMHLPALMAAICHAHHIAFATYSSDKVFNGRKGCPYLESDPVTPLNEYGQMEAQYESSILKASPSALAIRTGILFDVGTEKDSLTTVIRSLANQNNLNMSSQRVFSSSYSPDLVHTSLDLLVDGERGLWHLVNQGATTLGELVSRIAQALCLDNHLLPVLSQTRRSQDSFYYTVLNSERGSLLPSLEDALDRYCQEVYM